MESGFLAGTQEKMVRAMAVRGEDEGEEGRGGTSLGKKI